MAMSDKSVRKTARRAARDAQRQLLVAREQREKRLSELRVQVVVAPRHLVLSFADDRALADGSPLRAELAPSLLSAETNQTFDECVRRLDINLEKAVGANE